MYITSKTARVFSDENLNIIGVGSNQYVVDNTEFSNIIIILDYLKTPKKMEDIELLLKTKMIPLSCFYKLLDNKLIVAFNNNELEDRDIKNYLYIENIYNNPDKIIDNIRNCTFVIIGTGGIGNFVSFAINSFNTNKIILVDGDNIEESNLNRQFLFTESDIGMPKVKILKRELEKRNKNSKIITYNSFSNLELMKKIWEENKDENYFIILSGDSEGIVRDITEFAVKNEVPFLNVGYLNDISVIGPFFIPNFSRCPFCNNALKIEAENLDICNPNEVIDSINKNYTAPSTFMNNSIASSMAMIDILHYFDGNYENINSLNSRIGISNKDFQFLKVDIKLDENCICRSKNEV